MNGIRAALLVACGVASAGLATASSAAADETDHQKAATSFRAARADIAAGNCAAAVPKLEESLAYEPSVGAHLSLADCYEQVDLIAAWRKLQEAADLAVSKGDSRASIARDRAVALEPKLSMLHFVYAPPQTDFSGLEVRMDGSALKPFLLRRGTLATTPGTHAFEVSLPHKKTWRGQVFARSAGTSVDVNVLVEDESAPAAAAATPAAPTVAAPATPSTPSPAGPPESAPGNGQRTAAYVIGGAGVAGVALGAVFGFVALAKNADLRDACGGSVHLCRAAEPSTVTSAQDSARSAATISTVAFIAGGVALAAGVVLFATAPSSHRMEVGAAVVPGAASFSLRGRFE